MLQSNGLKGRISAKESITAKLNNKEVQVYPELEDLTVTPSVEEQHFKSNKYGYDNVTVKAVESKEIAIVPSVEEQVKEGIFNKVTVAGDSNLVPENIKEGTEIFGVIGNAKTSGETLNIKPTEEEQSYNGLYSQVNVDKINTEEVIADVDFSASDIVEINPTEGTYIKKAIVNKDINLIAENIKEGAEIFGVQGVAKTTDVKITDGYYLFYNNHRIDQVDNILKLCDNMTDASYMFYDCSSLTSLDLSNFDTSNVTNMGHMFRDCSTIKNINLSGFDTSKVTNMSYMFKGCRIIKNINLSGFDTSKVTDMSYMFNYCDYLKFPSFSSFDISQVTNMSYMFSRCTTLSTLDLSSFGTNKVTNMSYMFYGCTRLRTLDLSNFDASNVVSITSMFTNVANLQNFTSFKNLGKGYTQESNNYSSYKLSITSTYITYDSLMSVINNLYDLNLTYDVENGGTLYAQSLTLGSTNLAKLTAEEIAIATNKGWNVS